MPISSINIKNYKSIKDSGIIYIRPINILIGPNGVGKSNFISFFKLLNNIYKQRLRNFVAENGYSEKLLYFGRKKSSFLEGNIVFKPDNKNVNNRYDFRLIPQSNGNGFFFGRDAGGYNLYAKNYNENWNYIDFGGEFKEESELTNNSSIRADYLKDYFQEFRIFHFHDTGNNSPLKQSSKVDDNRTLREDGANLASYLYRIQKTDIKHFNIIEKTVKSVAPFFEKFDLHPDLLNSDLIQLNWFENNSDERFNAHNLSDGTLRFIALSTLLLQPNLPKTIIIDEPELGLHPFAIQKLGALIKSASTRSQLIISTQSVGLINQFTVEDLLIVNRENGQSTFKRLDFYEFEDWLKQYSLGELWEKNLLGGRPKN
ncbi:AAA family ATPase [Flavobacterium sp. LHD-80]|uniref:AAA family ATPase n=1 Tax=Flavobacterium sp. LHD-80 TaxID=3071411 RepID=UPI0027DFD235|nr:AAA family ATPase [Flavobacterium sp. LHD-80]MDQ6472753.1 AAA family ATPase [Flavobacterium sp. LHD-80]